jgi:catechol 2,3-dioxygenase-like lactoylglutathione lyase family enzyme
VTRFHFDCVFYYVHDMERTISFYSDVLGLRLTSRDVVARFDIDGVLFELVPSRGMRKLRGDGNARLCLKVDDISQTVEYLKTKGTRVGEIQKVENGKLVSFEDPDGNEIYLWQYD